VVSGEILRGCRCCGKEEENVVRAWKRKRSEQGGRERESLL